MASPRDIPVHPGWVPLAPARATFHWGSHGRTWTWCQMVGRPGCNRGPRCHKAINIEADTSGVVNVQVVVMQKPVEDLRVLGTRAPGRPFRLGPVIFHLSQDLVQKQGGLCRWSSTFLIGSGRT